MVMVNVFNVVEDEIRKKFLYLFGDFVDLVYNYWWSWNRRVMKFWEYIDFEYWREYKNLVKLFFDILEEWFKEFVCDDDFMNFYELVMD